jgi:AraC family transcriptional regulator of adaptative response/methylated-DNA-[protein]-cysteine methyltransferase
MMALALSRLSRSDSTTDRRWAAVLSRDRAADGRFVFAVRTTGIYCRPSCPARRPLRQNVRFFGDGRSAEAAGFRACLRCRPSAPGDPQAAWIGRVARKIESTGGRRANLAELARAAGVSPDHLQRTFKTAVGMSPRQYAEAIRFGSLKQHLRGGKTVTEATYEAGFGSGSRVYEKARHALGMTPAAYGRGGLGMSLAFATAATSLGRLLVAATARGICAVYLGDDDKALAGDLRREYPKAKRVAHEPLLQRWVDGVVAAVEGRRSPYLPLDVAGTAFQWKVWQALRAIPAGQTRSYAEIARAVGEPRSARAVARACATNRLSVIVPCHRVVGADGSLSGYRWGVARKKMLLDRESARTRAGKGR